AIWQTEGGDSNFERTTRVSSPKAAQVRRVPKRGQVGTAAESRNDPQEPNLTRESGNGSRSRPRGIAHRERRPRLSPPGREVQDSEFGAALAGDRLSHRARAWNHRRTSMQAFSMRTHVRLGERWPPRRSNPRQ